MSVSNPKVNKEAIRMLVQDIGYQRASDQTGIAYATLRQWAKRGGWNGRSVPHSQAVTTVTREPADAQAEAIAANGHETKLGLSEYAKRQAQHLATKGKLKDHGAFRNVTAGASQLHGWNEQGPAAQFSLNVLNLGKLQIGMPSDDATAHPMELVEGSETDRPTD